MNRFGCLGRRARSASAVFKIFVLLPKKTFSMTPLVNERDGPPSRDDASAHIPISQSWSPNDAKASFVPELTNPRLIVVEQLVSPKRSVGGCNASSLRLFF
jgi:hypothetical protein